MTTTRRGDAAVGAVCGAAAAVVATFTAGFVVPYVGGADHAWTAADLYEFVLFGLLGLVYVGWLTVPIGAALGSVVGVLVGRRLLEPTGLFASMSIGALAVGLALMISSGFDALAMASAIGALPGALGGGAAWFVARRITRRHDRASGVETDESDGASGEDGG